MEEEVNHSSPYVLVPMMHDGSPPNIRDSDEIWSAKSARIPPKSDQ